MSFFLNLLASGQHECNARCCTIYTMIGLYGTDYIMIGLYGTWNCAEHTTVVFHINSGHARPAHSVHRQWKRRHQKSW